MRGVGRPSVAADRRGHIVARLGMVLHEHYRVVGELGEGSFGKVLEAQDTHTGRTVAIKVFRAIDRCRDSAMREIKVLQDVTSSDPTGLASHCVMLRDFFEDAGHVCYVMDKYDCSVFDYMKANGFRPFEVDTVRLIGLQLLEALTFLHERGIVHTDLKPENMMLVDAASLRADLGRWMLARPEVKLIDFGDATYENAHHARVISARHYRAPEVVLGVGWSFPVDVWSVGCLLYELATGECLFATRDTYEHLAMMERVLQQPMPPAMVASADPDVAVYYVDGRLQCPRTAMHMLAHGEAHVNALRQLSVSVENADLRDLLSKVLEMDPRRRITAQSALMHRFFDPVRHSPLSRENSDYASSSNAIDSDFERVRSDMDVDEEWDPRLLGEIPSLTMSSSSTDISMIH